MSTFIKCIMAGLMIAGTCSCHSPSSGEEGTRKKEDSLTAKDDSYVKEYFDTQGRLYSRVTMKDDVPNGPSVSFYNDGTKNTEVNHVYGKKHGLERKFYGTGEVYRERTYDMGVQEGWEKRYYRSGILMSEVYYHQGMLSNQVREYDHEGDLEKFYPSIVFSLVRDRDYGGQRLLIVRLSNKSPNVNFYPGKLVEGKYLPPGSGQLAGKKGSGEIMLGGAQPGTRIDIVAKYITFRHTPVLITGSYVVK